MITNVQKIVISSKITSMNIDDIKNNKDVIDIILDLTGLDIDKLFLDENNIRYTNSTRPGSEDFFDLVKHLYNNETIYELSWIQGNGQMHMENIEKIIQILSNIYQSEITLMVEPDSISGHKFFSKYAINSKYITSLDHTLYCEQGYVYIKKFYPESV